MDILHFLLAPFVASLILTGHPRLSGRPRGGARRDLRRPFAGADCRAGHHHRGARRHGYRTAAAPIGSAWLHLSRRGDLLDDVAAASARIPQEAIIGISYAVASAAAILAMSKSTGSRPSTSRRCWSATSSPSPGMKCARRRLLYGLVGLFHYIFRKKFLLISMDPRASGGDRASRCASGTSCSTPRSASWSLRRWPSRACCWCSAT